MTVAKPSFTAAWLLVAAATAVAQTTAPAGFDLSNAFTVALWPDAPPGPTTRAAETVQQRVDAIGRIDRVVRNVSRPTLTAFLPPPNARGTPTPAVVLVPGGGYGAEVFDREGYRPAAECVRHGVAAFVLRYRLPEGVPLESDGALPVPILDAQRAVRVIRANAATWRVDPRQVGIVGFSAGGHVAGTVATHFDDAGAADATGDAAAQESARPDFAALVYAVSSMDASIAHAGSRARLLGPEPSAALVERFSTARQVGPGTPPLFVIHARDDRVVKFDNSVEVVEAARRANVPVEFVTLDAGGHGFGTGFPDTEPAGWMERLFAWCRRLPTARSVAEPTPADQR